MKKKSFKYLLLAIIGTFIILGPAAFVSMASPQQEMKEMVSQWRKIQDFYTRSYSRVPTERMAKKLYSMLPSTTFALNRQQKLGLGKLEFGRLALARNFFAVAASIRLLMGPGDWEYTGLVDSLSMLIRIDPELFLRALKSELPSIDKDIVKEIVNFIPEAYESPGAKRYLLEKRINSLRQVNDAELLGVRDICLEELNKGLKEIADFKQEERLPTLYSKLQSEEAIKKALALFVALPDENNARNFRDALDLSSENEKVKETIISLLYCFKEDSDDYIEYPVLDLDDRVVYDAKWGHRKEYYLLEYEALTGNKYAAEALFRLLCLRAASVRLDKALGFLAKLNPEIYLESYFPNKSRILKAFKVHYYPSSTIFDPLGTRLLERLIDHELILASIKRVSDKRYEELKNECLKFVVKRKDEVKQYLFERGWRDRNKYKKNEEAESKERLYRLEKQRPRRDSSWSKFREKLYAFIEKPSAERAKNLYKFIPGEVANKESEEKILSLEKLFSYPTYQLLEYEMMLGNVPTIRTLIKLLKYTNETQQQVIKNSLSSLVRINPQALLEAFYLESADSFFKENGYPVTFDLSLYKRSISACNYEMEQRKKVLGTIREEKFNSIIENCLKAIEEEKKNIVISSERKVDKFIYKPPIDFERAIKTVMDEPTSEAMRNIENIIRQEQTGPDIEDYYSLLIIQDQKEIFEKDRGLPSDRYLMIEREALAGNEGAIELLIELYPRSYMFFRDILNDTLSKIAVVRPELFFGMITKKSEISRNDIVEILSYLDRARTFPAETDGEYILKQRVDVILKARKLKDNRFVREVTEQVLRRAEGHHQES